MKRRVVFLVINSLGAGGAERQLCELAVHLDQNVFEVHVLVHYPPGYFNNGALWSALSEVPGIQLHNLNKKRGVFGYPVLLMKLWRLTRQFRADVLYGFLDATLPVLLVGRLCGAHVAWGIRRTFADLSKLSPLSQWLLRARIVLAPLVDLVIFNSAASERNHERMGMRARRTAVVPNGFDTVRFSPDYARGLRQRAAWNIPADAPLVGLVGRLDPVKDHSTFLRAAAIVHQEIPAARFICVGAGPAGLLASLRLQADELGIGDIVSWPGLSSDMPACFNALSVLALTSTDEGFPNAIGEAMACGIPCVTTKVGDAEAIVGDTGLAVNAGDVDAIARSIGQLLREDAESRVRRQAACRARIVNYFDVSQLARRTQDELLTLDAAAR